MKVVILCGGLGTRIRDVSESIPKPMVPVGPRPIVWHIMKYYSHFGFNEFILCLGYKKECFVDFFTNYLAHNSDLTVRLGALPKVTFHEMQAAEDWEVTLADTGLATMTGSRIRRVLKYIPGETFMLTYGDGLSNVDLPALLECHRSAGQLATICGVHPSGRFGEIKLEGNRVVSFAEKPQTTQGYINGGFLVLQREFVERYIEDDTACTLEADALHRCVQDGQLNVYCHDGFWQCMDTAREHLLLNELWEHGAPWKVW
jgi:glucose-1-phosphate cytidylyltransferase